MKKYFYIALFAISAVLSSCTNSDNAPSANDMAQRQKIEDDYQAKKQDLALDSIFSFCESDSLSDRERETMHFLYAYMPIGDITDYSPEYHLNNIRYSFRAKAEMPWGDSIPEREFNHFVVPNRVNNENQDLFRSTYYEELKSRVGNLSLYDAVLEVNHWCHEHVNYKGSDIRTSSPMATIKTSWGRCGEESTLLVAALRTVCIPARQVYTPRWAHTDDNHAWVEAYVDGKWYYLGACEPEPELNLGWFSEPASRALLIHTKVFGDYQGPEEVISRNDNYTEINVIDNYGATAKTTFTVVDEIGTPLPDVTVEFKIYNYAEYCTVAKKTTDENGQTWLTTGLGSMMAYASDNDKFGFEVFKAGEKDTITIVLGHNVGDDTTFDCDIIPPTASYNHPEISEAKTAENSRRLSYEDSLRNAYIATFPTKENVQHLKELQYLLPEQQAQVWELVQKSQGNHQVILDFIIKNRWHFEDFDDVYDYLKSFSDKDLRDASTDILEAHWNFFDWTNYDWKDRDLPKAYGKGILPARISNEMITPYRQTLSTFFSEEETQQFRNDPLLLTDWVRQNIAIREDLNPQRIPISPVGVLTARKADKHSRDIFFVAMARSIDIPAKIDPVTGKVQYYSNKKWIDIDFETEQTTENGKGILKLDYTPTAATPDPKYYTHFSIKKFDGTHFNLLAYDAQDPGIDDGMNLSKFPKPIELEAGYYILTTGTRLDDGTALAHSQFFTIKENETTKLDFVLRQPDKRHNIIGTFDTKSLFEDITTSQKCSISQCAGQDLFILGLIDHGSEPTTHAMSDIAVFSDEFNKNGTPLLLVFKSQDEYDKFKKKNFGNLPTNTRHYIDNGDLCKELAESLHLGNSLPIFIIADSKGNVFFAKQGYTIGLGEQMLKVLSSKQ